MTCEGCGEEQGTIRKDDVEYYEHEGRCPACGEYVVCVSQCIKEDEE